MSLREQIEKFLKSAAEKAVPLASVRPVKCWDFRDKSLTLMPSKGGQNLYVQYHGAFGETPHVGDYVIFKAAKPQGTRYRVTEVKFHDVDWAWFAHLEFAPRTTQQEVEQDERALRPGS